MEYTRLPLEDAHKVFPVSVTQNGVTHQCELNVNESNVYSLILYSKATAIKCKQVGLKEFPEYLWTNKNITGS